jgi:alginate O-acetyltransferase complex protein AlgI
LDFSSTIFLFLFLPIVLSLSLIVPKKYSNYFLLTTSLAFYAWGEIYYILVLVCSITVNHLIGLFIQHSNRQTSRKSFLAIGITANLGILSTFKYTDFLTKNLNEILAQFNVQAISLPDMHWPVGVSFFTFQAITYIVDIYRRDASACKNPIDSALYISFFPRLIAGPIAQYRHTASQLSDRTVTSEKFARGVKRFIIGLGKKILIANTLAGPANSVFGLLPSPVGTELAWLAAVCFTLQIYFDFSGYSDMAIGLGLMLGFEIPENFNYPYVSKSIREFWRRWHITLSNWFRDYLYIPLGGNRLTTFKTYRNLLLVFFLCGLWHGPNWTFVVWGLYHGLFMVIERIGLGNLFEKKIKPLGYAYATLVVMIGWVFFRAPDLSSAFSIIRSMFFIGPEARHVHTFGEFANYQVLTVLGVAILASTPFFKYLKNWVLRAFATREPQAPSKIRLLGSFVGLVGLVAILILCFVSVAATTHNPFIYAQF